MNIKIHIENQELEFTKAELHLWLSELIKSNFSLNYIGTTESNALENNLEDAIYFSDLFENQFGIVFQGLSSTDYAKIRLNTTIYSKSFHEIEKPTQANSAQIYCFLVKEILSDKILGYVKFIPIKYQDNFIKEETKEAQTTYKISANLSNLNSNLSQTIFRLIPSGTKIDKVIRGKNFVFNNKFCLLLQEEPMENAIAETTLRIELGEIKIPNADISSLKAGNVLEISDLKDLTAKIFAGETEIAQANFLYNAGSISLKIFSDLDSSEEKDLNQAEKIKVNNRFIRRFFNENTLNNNLI